MTFSPIDEIKSRLDIVEVVRGYIKLQKAGANFRAICPFHSEKKPSLFVSPTRQIWNCFGCSRGGDIFGFVKEIEGVEFGDALRILAQKAGVELKRQDPKLKTERQRLYEVCEISCKFFEKQLESSQTGKLVKEYLVNRGVTNSSLKKWRLGYAPDSWQGLADFLIKTGYSHEEVKKAGLNLQGKEGKYYDRFRGRIMFPIFDLNSQVVGFGGRVFGKDVKEAKYMNIPSTLLYDKSRILYGLNTARVEIRKKEACILVEGYMDAILSHQAGFENTVATSGTALTPFQLQILKRYSENLLTAFDTDIAGDTATRRGIDLAQAQGFTIKVITMQEGKDPADIASVDPKEWEKLVSGAKSILEFYFQNAFSKFDKQTPEGKKNISKFLLPVIRIIPNKIEQSHWIQQLAKNLNVAEEIVSGELLKVKLEKAEIEEKKPVLQQKSRKELLEERLAFLMVKYPKAVKVVNNDGFFVFSPKIQEIFSHLEKGEELSREAKELFNAFSLRSEVENVEEKDAVREAQFCIQEGCSLVAKDKMEEISREIRKAEQEKNSEKAASLIEEFNKLSQKLNHS
ncbi:DNA primase [Patescibacteria group bacterium]